MWVISTTIPACAGHEVVAFPISALRGLLYGVQGPLSTQNFLVETPCPLHQVSGSKSCAGSKIMNKPITFYVNFTV